MALTLVRGTRWGPLVDHAAAHLQALGLGPFDRARVVVASRETGRLAGQGVAARLGISAGIAYVTPAALLRELAERAGVAQDRARWLGSPLDLAVWGALDEVAQDHPLLAAALEADAGRPGRRRATAIRLARLLRGYVDVAPEVIGAWMEGAGDGADGHPLPEATAWQPPLLRAATASLEVDPLHILAAITEAAATDPTPTVVLAVDHVTVPQAGVFDALAAGVGVTALQISGSPGAVWAQALATRIVDLPGATDPAPEVEIHESHGEARQVEVLRDELTRAFAKDPTLEPRHVAIVCPQPERYADLLDAAFAPGDPTTHPGRTLRVQRVESAPSVGLVELLVELLRLGESRATASAVVELLLRPAIAHRWRLTDRAAVTELVSGAGIRWGMDLTHRAAFGLPEVGQNTWLRGLDRLLVGLAVAPGHEAGVGLSGADAVSASDMDTVGALCEIVSRLRRLVAVTDSPATIASWVGRCREAMETLVGLPRTEEWQLTVTARTLARLASDHRTDETLLTRHEFALMLEEAASTRRTRAAAGNGSLMVVGLGELMHVEFRLVALLGVTDDVVPGRVGLPPDSIALGDLAPDPRARRLEQLLTHARSAERVLIVRQRRSQRTNDEMPVPVALSWLLDQLGGSHRAVTHPPIASSESNFEGTAPSFDAPALAGVLARRRRSSLLGRHARRRLAARTLPVASIPGPVTLAQLSRFLADPAKSFLQSAAGITQYQDAQLTDEIDLETKGLSRWAIIDDLLESWKAGTDGRAAEEAFRQREQHPPLAIGRLGFAQARADAEKLWRAAEPDWNAELASHQVHLRLCLDGLGEVALVDEIRTRGGVAVALTASSGEDKLIGPWLESLALAASGGGPAVSRVHRLIRPGYNGAVVPESRTLATEDVAQARAVLELVVRAYVLGQRRLLPVPAAAAIAYAQDELHGGADRAAWTGSFRSYHPKWSWPGRAWQLFYDSDVAELFTDAPLPEDPGPPRGSAFEQWALALYTPMLGGFR